MKKNLLLHAWQFALIALPWLLISSFDFEAFGPQSAVLLLIPLLWAAAFTYLRHRKHLYSALNAYMAFLLMLWGDSMNFQPGSSATQFSYTAISLLMAAVIVLIRQKIGKHYPPLASALALTTTLALTLPAVFFIAFAVNFDAAVTPEVIFAVLQSNLGESLDFIGDWISPTSIAAAAFLAVLIAFLASRKQRGGFHAAEALMLPCLFAAAYSLQDHLRLYNFIFIAHQNYTHELQLFRSLQEKVEAEEIQFKANKNESGEIYVLVIGEALNKVHMSLYGYVRETTPKLKALSKSEGAIVFSNAFASHTHTQEVLPRALTEVNNNSSLGFFQSLSIINILNKAKFHTHWITNQPLYGYHTNITTIVASQSDLLTPLNHFIGRTSLTNKHDGAVLDELKKAISQEGPGNKAVFIHLMGSHNSYRDRYPDSHSAYSGRLAPAQFGNLHHKPVSTPVNWYDNSILYNDHVVASIVEIIGDLAGVSGLVYFADHADDVVNLRGHNSANFSFEMTQIPLLMWFSSEYRQSYPEKYRLLKKHSDKLFSTDSIYDTLIGVSGVKTGRYQPQNDLSSSLYELDEDSAHVLHGRLPYAQADNYQYHQPRNIQILKERGQGVRVIPHRVNSLGKLSQVVFDGYAAFEVDVLFQDASSAERPQLEVGHDADSMSGLHIQDFLAQAPAAEKVWLDIKNLSSGNHQQVLRSLNGLDAQFDLRKKAIVESSFMGPEFSAFSKAGWHTSYYLPTNRIWALLEAGDSAQMQVLANAISQQSRSQMLSALSFNARLYPFVKSYLAPLLDDHIVYHTWDINISLADKGLMTVLGGSAPFQDPRVKTILVVYRSPFHL